ncbi:hypothetical protein PV327_011374, partial [Microctonus hyperodae]
MENNKCSIGTFMNEECAEGQLTDCNDFSDEDRITLNARSGTVVNFICHVHDKRFRRDYILNEKVCADPYNIHVTKARKSLRTVTFEWYNRVKAIVPSIAPGSKLCISCSKRIRCVLKDHGEITTGTFEQTVSTDECDDEPAENISGDSSLNTYASIITSDQEETPFTQSLQLMHEKMSSDLSEKLQISNVSASTSEIYSSTNLDRSKSYAQRKYYDMKSALQLCFEHVMDDTFDTVESENLNIDGNPELTGREMIVQLKNKFNNTNKLSEKLQILSVLPSSWSTEK